MPAKEIKELRQAGQLEEALNMAQSELDSEPENIWAKRNIGWVYYEYLKLSGETEKIDDFLNWLNKLKNLNLPEAENMLIENIAWKIGSLVFKYYKSNQPNYSKLLELRDISMSFNYTKPSEAYSFLFKAFHKALKDTDAYLSFADWWNFENFMPEDFQKEKMPNGKEIMAIVEQAYITYSKHLLPKYLYEGGILSGEVSFDVEKVRTFLVKLNSISESYPQYQYPGYFQAKLLLALGEKDNMLKSLLPFAKKKRNDFWVWEILSEAFSNEPDKVFACYCKALTCKSPEEMLVSLRQKMARVLISREQYNEAKTEIDLLVQARTEHGYNIPMEVINWQSQDWYKTAVNQKSNINFYKQYIAVADTLLFSDTPEVSILVEFVNRDKKILNFIASDNIFGFLKYDRFFSEVKIGDVLKVRFQGGSKEGMYQLYTGTKSKDDDFKRKFMKEVSGKIKIPAGKSFGFLEDVFIHPSIVAKLKLSDGIDFSGIAIKTYSQEKKKSGWKLI